MLAVVRTVHGVPTLVIAAVTGQTGYGVLVTAGLHALDLADTAANDIGATAGSVAGAGGGQVSAAGGDRSTPGPRRR